VKSSDAKLPDPLREHPPADRFCDLILNGGIASGVVYPWALLHLARHYRFKSIGGNSVGAMAAALAAAAEYGRCNGVEDAFEPLRQMPIVLAEEAGDPRKTKMLRLFQPTATVSRLFECFLIAVGSLEAGPAKTAAHHWRGLFKALGLYGFWRTLLLLEALALLLVLTVFLALGPAACAHVPHASCDHQALLNVGMLALLAVLAALGSVLIACWCLAGRVHTDLRALATNFYGLCTGRGQQPGEEGLVEWLHKGIQLSAGRGQDDPPLTFADLWAAPRFGQPGPGPRQGGLQPEHPGIELQMFTSNVSQGRPVRLPLNDANTRLYFDPQQWAQFFPPTVLDALTRASPPYVPASISDPDPVQTSDAQQLELMARLRELPSGAMPIVVAARLSLCFPVLFACVPVYAIDYEAPVGQRHIRRCLLSDGGLCTNFPVHLFDAAHPRWPTFALLLDKRLRAFKHQKVWLPRAHLQGRADNWQREVPGVEHDPKKPQSLGAQFLGLGVGLLLTMKDWNDRVTGRLPQVRNRLIRLALKPGQGQLNIAMPRQTILSMAHDYGTRAGVRLVKTFAPRADGLAPAWREHLYVRSMVELRALRQHLKGYTAAVQARGDSVPLNELFDEASGDDPLLTRRGYPDPNAAGLNRRQSAALKRAVRAVESLEAELAACEPDFGPYEPVPEPELHLRPPI
jgi:predicted acylesterase/phospholipase RssA